MENYEEELAELKARADLLGIKYRADTTLETLRNKVNEKLSISRTEPMENTDTGNNLSVRENALRLIRCRITCNNPAKASLYGEIFTIANKYIGSVSKYVPYKEGNDSYHLPFCLFQMLKNRKFVSIDHRKDQRTGKERVIVVDRPEFTIEELPPLTPEELKELAQQQAARDTFDKEDIVK